MSDTKAGKQADERVELMHKINVARASLSECDELMKQAIRNLDIDGAKDYLSQRDVHERKIKRLTKQLDKL